MLSEYIRAAMRQAHYEILPDSGTIYGTIPGLQGVWAEAANLEACREDLQTVLEDWLMLGLRMGHPLPVLEGIDLNPREGVA
ncbi:MAG: type II toxin-antitoxin system HicB family antitoxin [Chloroflexi bacterium]|nr:type II toxin-antitoxin system HicB family antitoxin [Chloroflexota bacterium]